ncbi:hypothetical protein C8R44DRAFT_869433 [Mycena epipterygia]|nr:hypothetical protein C8R44DRAFT_869433 [Mycena epipterygia]
MSGVFVIVDDQDPKLDFSAGWGPTTAENSFQYGGTMTAPGPQGSTATYTFNGSSISVFSRIGANLQNTTTTLSFAIDNAFVNSTIVKTDQFEHFHQLLFHSPPLMEGSHTLVVTLTNITSKDVFLDYLIYEASQNSTLDSSSRLLILNTSPYLAYSQGWSPGIVGLRPGLIEPAVSLNNSVAGAADLGATVAFNFTGTAFEIRGLLVMPFPSAVAAYSLDGGPLVNVQMPVNGTSYFNAVSNFEFIGQTFNGVGSHSLVITPLIPAAFFLDYIIVQSSTAFFPQKADVAISPVITRSTPSSAPSASTQSSTPSYTTLPSSTTLPSASSRAGLHPGAIAGIAVGVGACLLLASVAWYLVHRRSIRDRWRGCVNGTRSQQGGLSGNTTAARSDPETANLDFTPYTTVSVVPVFRSKMDRGASATRSNTGSAGMANSNNPAIDVEPPAYIDPCLIPIVAP